jgi:hypothetical protein
MDTPRSAEKKLTVSEANQRGARCLSEALGREEDWESLTAKGFCEMLKTLLLGEGLRSLPPQAVKWLTVEEARDVVYALTGTEPAGSPREGEIRRMFVALKHHSG